MSAQVFTLTNVIARQKEARSRYYEFLRMPTMSAGLYRLAAQSDDPQRPHGEDELYHVLLGHATLQVDGQDHLVGPGSLVFVPAGATHRFHTITEDLEVIVVFAPAESHGGGGC
ncbi:MAG TPA: cupin domain-containing protein [Gemmatimonadales bacterium]|nr:cupin domain-containing protein [Gemmatimonadales bacterium]